MKKYRFTIRKKTSRFGVGSTIPEALGEKPLFRYASVCKLSKHRCRVCGNPIRRTGIRRVVRCPVCNAENSLP